MDAYAIATAFKTLQVRDALLRSSAISALVERMERMESDHDGRQQLLTMLPTALRLSRECPFEDIRLAMSAYLAHAQKDLNMVVPEPLPASAWLAPEQLPPGSGSGAALTDERLQRVYEWSFLTNGYIGNAAAVLSYHPTYLESYCTLVHVLTVDDGPLPLAWRPFIGLLAASRHSCHYLMRHCVDAFIAAGGDPAWLRDGCASPAVPLRLRALAEVNAILAHRPWMMRKEHIKALTAGAGEASWSLNELVHALTLLTSYHAASSLVLAIGVCPEPDSGITANEHPCRPYYAHAVSTAQPHGAAEDGSSASGGAPGSGGGVHTGRRSSAGAESTVTSGAASAAAAQWRNSTHGTGALGSGDRSFGRNSGGLVAYLGDAVSVAERENELRSRLLKPTAAMDYEGLSEIGAAPPREMDRAETGVVETDEDGSAAATDVGSGSRRGASSGRGGGAGGGSGRHRGGSRGGWNLQGSRDDEEEDDEDFSDEEDEFDDEEDEYDDEDEEDDDYDDDEDDEEEVEIFERAGQGPLLGIEDYDDDASTHVQGAMGGREGSGSRADGPQAASATGTGSSESRGGGDGAADGSSSGSLLDAARFRGAGVLAVYQSVAPPPSAAGKTEIEGVRTSKQRKNERRRQRKAADAATEAVSSPRAGGDSAARLRLRRGDGSAAAVASTDVGSPTAAAAATAAAASGEAEGARAEGSAARRSGWSAAAVVASAAAAEGRSGGAGGAGSAGGSGGGVGSGPLSLAIETLRYRDFDTSDGMFVTHDFSWEEHGFMLVSRYFAAAAPALDRHFKLTLALTYRRFSKTGENVNTEPFRTAVWYYIQRLYGVRNDHYDYAMVNKFMTITTKGFAKKVACYPEALSALDFDAFTSLFTPDERVHIVMLVSEARRQAALLYALHAVMKSLGPGA